MGVIYITMLFWFRNIQRANRGHGGWWSYPWGVPSFLCFLRPAVAVWIVSALRGAAPVDPFWPAGVFKKSCKSVCNIEYDAKYLFNGVLNTICCGAWWSNHKIYLKYSIMAYYPAAGARVLLQGGPIVFRRSWAFQWLCLFAAAVDRNNLWPWQGTCRQYYRCELCV